MNTQRIKIVWAFTLALGLGIGLMACLPATPTRGLFATPPALPVATALPATTYYVRPDGGSADECTGLVDAPYPGSGTGQDCAWDHPFRALQPSGEPGEPGTTRIAGGDTLVIAAGSYRIGHGAPGADACVSDYPWDCVMPPVPSGPDDAHPTRILGVGWDTGCANPPELWGTERAAHVLDLTGADHAEIACLEITDHAACAEDHSGGLACANDAYPYGDWASDGLYAEDATDVYLHDLNIHGLASAGVRAGRLTDWTVEDVRIAGNGLIGWEGDIGDDSSNSGTLLFRRWTAEWNGCAETYPGDEPTGCWDENFGGYGDGVGTGATGGDWIIEDSAFLHNASDGLDLLYHRLGGSITIRRTIAEGNAGNQIKANGPTSIENSIIVGNCGYFDGQPFTYNVENCRAYGNALALNLQPGDQITMTNNTLTSEGDCLVEAICEGACDGSEVVRMRNNIFLGQTDFAAPEEKTCFVYTENLTGDPLDADYSIIYNTKEDPCPVGPHDICQPPGLTNPSIDAFDAHLLPDSPAIDAGDPAYAPSVDILGAPRPIGLGPDMGAFEYQEYGFTLTVTPTARVINPGGVATYTIAVRPVGGFSTTISLTTATPSPSLTLQLGPAQVIPPGLAVLTASDTHTGTALSPGLHYDIPITGTNGVTQTTYASLIVGGARVYLPLMLNGLIVTQSQSSPTIAGCSVFPADNIWNTPVDTLPVHANSDAYVAVIGADEEIHADFGSGTWEGGPIGIPYTTVSGVQATVSITFTYDDESDPGPYPIPPDAPIEGGPDSEGDRHILIVDRDNCILYELYAAYPQPDGSWTAGSGAIFDLNSNALREEGWTSADAAGLPILSGLVRYDEVATGEIRHALRFTANSTRQAYVWPARHFAPYNEQPNSPPMGQRFRLKADFDISGFPPEVQVILQALKKYGMILADNGSSWFISGVPDERWDNEMLHELDRVLGSDFEAVDVSSLMVHPDSGQTGTDQ